MTLVQYYFNVSISGTHFSLDHFNIDLDAIIAHNHCNIRNNCTATAFDDVSLIRKQGTLPL